ncbi:GGDEF domain-containing protein [Algicella marina]|nr:GGDEF domain-containing protein [Algicella marina]
MSARAIAFAQHYGTELTPNAYAVWFAYCNRHNQVINTMIDKAMNTGRPITLDMLNTLYLEQLSPRAMSDEMVDIGSRMAATIGDVSEAVEEKIKAHTMFSGKLRSAKQSLSLGTSKAEVSAVIASLHKANQEHIVNAQKMGLQLEKNRAQVAKLKSELIEARRNANTDYLTGLANRRMLDDHIQTAIFEARQKKQRVCLVMAAIDGLEKVTKSYGMTAGDNVVVTFADELKKELTGSRVAARFEGARFAVLLPDTHDREAFAIAERVRKAFRERDWVSQETGEKIGQLTASFSGVMLNETETHGELFERADARLTRLQSGSGDTVRIA